MQPVRLIGLSLAVALASAPALAQDRAPPGGDFGMGRGGGVRGGMAPLSAEDRAAFTDARLAALHAGLKLTPDQAKLWPPVEEAIRGLVQQRAAAREARRDRFAAMRDADRGADIPGGIRFIADRQAASAEALRKVADALQPLYTSLDDGQKRRMAWLSRPFMRALGGGPMRRGGMPGRGFGDGGAGGTGFGR